MKVIVLPKKQSVKRYCLFASLFCVLAMVAALDGRLLRAELQQPIRSGEPGEPKVALACNVFWGEEHLPSMLDTLAQNDVKISFFIGGTWAKEQPAMLQDIAGRGHELANHSYSHPHPNKLSKQKNKEQIIDAENIIKEVTGIKTALYAPPYGEYNDTVLAAAQELNYPVILWSIDTVDWQHPSPDIIKSRVLKKIHNGAIILMHPTAETAKALPELIAAIKEKGYSVTTVGSIVPQE